MPVLNFVKMYIILYVIISIFNSNTSEAAEKVRYISTEHPRVTYFNPKYLSFANLTSKRYGRSSPIYYVGLHFIALAPFGENVLVDLEFFELLTNVYKPSFIRMHHNFCDLLHKNLFFGRAMKQGKLDQPCPYPPGEYHLSNMSIPFDQIPRNFPIIKGRICANVTLGRERVAEGYINMEVKEWNPKRH